MVNKKIGDACIIKTGKLDSNHAVPNGEYPFFTCAANPDRIDTYAYDDDVVLVAGNNAQGNFHVNRFKGKFNAYQRTYILTAKQGFDIDYIYYALKLELKRLKEKSQGSQTKFITMPILTGIHLTDLDFGHQHKVAAVLYSLDAKIELNNRINANLEATAKTLYDYWFVQFDFPDQNGKPYKSCGGKMVYNDALKREIPEGWSVKKLCRIAKTSLGGTPDTKNMEYWENADIAWLSSAEIAEFPVIESEQFITQKGIENSAAVLIPTGSVVVSIVRYIRPSILGIEAATNQSVVAILESDKFKKSFIYPFLCGEIPRLMGLRTGAQQPHINKGVIDETLAVIPNDEILEEYYKIAESIFDGIIIRAFETQQLTQIRDWLLPMLMNGQVTVA